MGFYYLQTHGIVFGFCPVCCSWFSESTPGCEHVLSVSEPHADAWCRSGFEHFSEVEPGGRG